MLMGIETTTVPNDEEITVEVPDGGRREVLTTANVAAAGSWDGIEGDHWTEYEEHYNAASARYDPRLYAAAQLSATDHVLDIGCGCGVSTRGAARIATSGAALGVDLSTRMIERARERSRSEKLTNIRFEHADAQVHRFEEAAVDVVISRFGAMFFGDPVAAFANIRRALRTGGRLALLSWQELARNEWVFALRTALAAGRALPDPPPGIPGPFGLADAGSVQRILADAGFTGVRLEETSERVQLGADVDDAFGFVSTLGLTRGMLDGLDDTARTRALQELRTTLALHDTGQGVLFDSRAWLITAHRG